MAAARAAVAAGKPVGETDYLRGCGASIRMRHRAVEENGMSDHTLSVIDTRWLSIRTEETR